MNKTLRSAFSAVWFAALVLTSNSLAQCTNPWTTVPGSPGVEGQVSSMLVFDPDGPGPIGQRVLVAGKFAVAGDTFAENLAVYDPVARTWSAFGPGPYPANLRLVQTANGDIYVAGNFTSIAGVAAACVARWDGANWSALGSGLGGTSQSFFVESFAALPSGGVVVTGQFTSAGGTPALGIASWDGSSWSSLGAAALGGSVTFGQVIGLPNGDIAAGVVHYNGSTNFTGVMTHDGSTWSQLGPLPQSPRSLFVAASGELHAAGQFGVARWNGTIWLGFPTPPIDDVFDVDQLPNGALVAAGHRNYNPANLGVLLWDGFQWTTVGEAGSGGGRPALAVVGNELFLGGSFAHVNGAPTIGIARWDGWQWSGTNPGLAGSPHWLAVSPDNTIFAGLPSAGISGSRVHRWTGLGWSGIGGGFWPGNFSFPLMRALHATPRGRLISGGLASGGTGPLPILQEWTGTAWTTLLSATGGSIDAIVELPNGDLVAGGTLSGPWPPYTPRVVRFDGTDWTDMVAGLPAPVTALAASPEGQLFALSNGSAFRWAGSAWSQLGLTLPGAANALVVDRDGAPVVAGDFAGVGVLRWNGVTWAPLGNGPDNAVQSLVVLANGDLVAGPVASAASPRSLQRWDGTAWTPLGGPINGTVWALALAGNGDLLLAGDFTVADGVPRAHFARVSTSCPATVFSVPSGCGSAWPVLASRSLPWIGGICRTTATDLWNYELAVVLTGVQDTALPLGTLLSLPAGSCQLRVVPILFDLAVAAFGRIEAQFVVPDSTAMIGSPLHQQVVALDIDASGSITSAIATNALVFVTGSF